MLDPTLLGIEGIASYEQVRARNRAAVIFVLGGGSEANEVRSLEAGADDYAKKRSSPWVLLARVRSHLHSREAPGNKRILHPGDLWLDKKNYATRVKAEWVDLRPQEFRLLIARGVCHGLSDIRSVAWPRAESSTEPPLKPVPFQEESLPSRMPCHSSGVTEGAFLHQ